MQTSLTDVIKRTSDGEQAEAIIRTCVHCGFCLATCPTYQLLGNELDSPRGRIYLIKEALEGKEVTANTQLHLDRCLTCRACETTCPSGVEYGRLLDIGREHVEQQVGRDMPAGMFRHVLRKVLTHQAAFSALLRVARVVAPLLPRKLRRKVPARRTAAAPPVPRHARKMLLLDGCVQPVLDPAINSAAIALLDRIGLSLIVARSAGCCGAIAYHMNVRHDALDHVRRNVDAWWPALEAGAEGVVVTASGCGPMLQEYGHLLQDDPAYAHKAARISSLTRDVSQLVADHREALLAALRETPANAALPRVAFHSPCTLQHGLKLNGVVERILRAAGFEVLSVADAHLCCGSAGTYSITQPELSDRLLDRKITALEQGKPDVIATANIGCLMHLSSAARAPVVHWVELLAERLGVAPRARPSSAERGSMLVDYQRHSGQAEVEVSRPA